MPEETFVLKACWRRKEVTHPIADKDIVNELARSHPYTIRITPNLFAEYTRIYGADEAAILYAPRSLNAVESREQAWVKGGVYVAADPRPVPPEETLGPGESWIIDPFGNHMGKVKKPVSAPTDLNQNDDLEALIDRVMVSVLRRAGLWKDQ